MAVGAGSVWVADYRNGTVTRIDATTEQELAQILVGGNLRRVAANGGRVWVLDTSGSVARIIRRGVETRTS